MKAYTYATSCVGSTAEAIDAMLDRAREISLRTFKRHCREFDDWCRGMSYSVGNERGLHIKDDWAVRFHKSVYRGRPCFYVTHSAVEHIWTLETIP